MKMKLYNPNNKKDIDKLYKKQFNLELKPNDKIIINAFYDNDKFVGYTICEKIDNKIIKIHWIYGPTFGKQIMKKLENKFKKDKYDIILLNISVDPTEDKNIVMKRINFYIGLQYKKYDIKFRKTFGPLFYMKKYLTK